MWSLLHSSVGALSPQYGQQVVCYGCGTPGHKRPDCPHRVHRLPFQGQPSCLMRNNMYMPLVLLVNLKVMIS